MMDGRATSHPSAEPVQGRRGRRKASAWAAFLVLIILANMLASCGVSPAMAALPAAADTTDRSTASSTTTSPPATLSPTLTALPTVLAAAYPKEVKHAATVSASPEPTTTSTPSPSATDTPTRTFTPTDTPTTTASPTSTPPAPATWTSTPHPSPLPAVSPSPVPTSELTQEVLTILLIGGDRDYVLDMNTDTLIVAVVDRSTRQVSLLSIPRDLWVHIPTYGWGRINVAHRIGARSKYPEGGGPGLLMRTIKENLGIPIDHWARIGYEGFARAVDELGGVDMVVGCKVNLRYQPPDSEDEQEMILWPGIHHLDGATALRYVRTRRGDTDFERAQRQQQFLKAVWYQFKSPETALKIPGLWTAMKGAFATDLKLGDILALAPVALELEPQRVRSLAIGRGQVESWTTLGGARVLLPIPERVQEVVARLYAPPSTNDTANEAARIEVQNGTERAQLARIAADQLRWEGLKIVDTGPADRTDYQKTQIIVFNDQPQALARLTRFLQVKPANVIQQPDPGQQADLRVILGNDYEPCR
jgi:LCP family protein required for cell wall assembly